MFKNKMVVNKKELKFLNIKDQDHSNTNTYSLLYILYANGQ